MMMRFKDSPEGHRPANVPPRQREQDACASIRIGGTDGHGVRQLPAQVNRDSRVSRLRSVPTMRPMPTAYSTALAEGGQVQMPLGKTFFTPSFGMLADRFGVAWMVIVEP